jgi:outer membrane lipoprotein LolB
MRGLTIVGVVWLMAACATSSPPPASVDVEPDVNWTLQGRIALKSGEQNLSGQLQWQRQTGRDELLLASPMGQGVARIMHDRDGVLLEIPNETPRRAPDAESLTREVLGYPLPLSGLAYWIQARPDPGRPYQQTSDDTGRLSQLMQDGWVIDFLQYMPDHPARPRKLVVSREDIEIRLVVDAWQTE